MTEGIASGPGDFQRKIEQCLAGIEGPIPYLDNIFCTDKNGLHKSESKVKAMIEAPTPTNKKQLESFLGLITYYSRFIPSSAEMLKPLYECVSRIDWKWTTECEKAFRWVKRELTSERVLAHYDPNEDFVLACDNGKNFYNYVFGKEITLRTDHKPLIFIFGPKQEIPLTTASIHV
ncbi:hypothetical protein KPH14_009893 [Odynerus spinipes]|uniref:RNA-directed DNA polymerase n=1 Tax=Odynerus spinipes TaxID=1348599 RepID=A0AAD9RE84_9HYME|nr:hypothetical protein KPH14_009893 [Odynerus spinipes]